ncbi:MAG: hypothetical protein Q8K58_13910 [Acidimicrobiales bacterium]|nr:hypothetical protein [Acidimicrobiales bacterium]
MLAVATVALAAACSGPEADPPTSSTISSSTTTRVPRFTGDPSSPFCTLLRDVDVEGVLDGEPTTPEEVGAGFRRLVEVLDEAARTAPREVEADAVLLAEGVAALDAALAAVGYDFDALASSPNAVQITEAVNDPAFTVAGDRLEAYRDQVCGL